MEDEENWESKDTFQQASMAQTRSMSKALANKFRWVVVLAGYATTPVEEMQGITPRDPSVLGFGKHKGKALSEVPVDYLEWLLTDLAEKKNKPDLQAAICAEFERRNAAKDNKGDNNLYEWVLNQLKALKPNQGAQAIGIRNTYKDHPKLSVDQRTALVDYFNEHWGAKDGNL